MITLPIDEMLDDLRTVLDAFESDPTPENFDAIQKETMRIEVTCESELEIEE